MQSVDIAACVPHARVYSHPSRRSRPVPDLLAQPLYPAATHSFHYIDCPHCLAPGKAAIIKRQRDGAPVALACSDCGIHDPFGNDVTASDAPMNAGDLSDIPAGVTFPYSTGAGWFALSNGARVRDEATARSRQAVLNIIGNRSPQVPGTPSDTTTRITEEPDMAEDTTPTEVSEEEGDALDEDAVEVDLGTLMNSPEADTDEVEVEADEEE